MKKVFLSLMLIIIGVSALAQQKIQLRSADKAECVKSDMTSLKAVFSFSGIEANDLQNERGVFSTLSMPNTVVGGNVGDPQIPVMNKMIAVPIGATPNIRVTSYSTKDYNLEDYGIHKLSPRQPDVMKDQKPEFVYNEASYQKRGLSSEPIVRASVNGTMRGVQVGQFSIEPVSYDPVNNTLRVFNDIEVEISFDGADVRATEDLLVKTYSPYFDILYKQLFNGRAVLDVYEDHPDLWKTPLKMLVIANRMFESTIQNWVAWKTMKGIVVDVNYTDVIGTTADAIKSFIQTKYAQDAPTFLVIMGDQDQVAPSIASASETHCVADLYYSSVDGDQFVDMYHSRMSAETTAEMTALINKCLEYEQYTMPDPSYLNNVLLIAGEDSGYGVTVGRPTIWYASHYYFNAEHGYENVYEFSQGTYTNCYAPLSSGVGFANYTAHGSKTSWAGPEFNVENVANLTNEHKYFLAMGNCCQSGDWGYTTTCFGEALTRAENKGAYAYIGSCPNTTWYNDYYFGVGATTVNTDISSGQTGTMPTLEQTTMGFYDALWMDDAYNTVNSLLYVGLLACNAAQALGYEMHSSTLYYWQAYHVIGDGSIMPYRVQPTANNVSHMPIIPIGMNTYEVSAAPGSYVAISKEGVLLGAALVGDDGTVQVPITPITSSGNVTICVTAPNRIPSIETVPAAALEGAYLAVDSFTPTSAHVGDNTNLSITFKNVGTDATVGNTNITLTSADPDVVSIIGETGSFGPLAAEATTTVSGFSFKIAEGVADGTNVTIHYTAENGEDTYEGNIVIKANEAKLEYAGMTWNGGFTPGETLTLTAKFKNTGHYQATNATIELTATSNNYVTIHTQPITGITLEVGQEVAYDFSVTINANCPETAVIPVTFTMTADGGLTASGNETLKNSCNVVFNLNDSYGDGWNSAALVVSFDDGSASQSLTFSSGSSASQTLEIGNGVHITLTWMAGNYDYECSFTVSYEGDLTIYQSSGTPSAGVLYEFDCNCAAASQTFNVTVASENIEHGTVSGDGEYGFGESCTVTATPNEGYLFLNWTSQGEIVSTLSSYTFIVNSDISLTAHFDEGNMIGDGGDATNESLPSFTYYNYSLSQQIYTAEELGSAGVITSIAFFNDGAEKTRSYDFYLMNTEKETFSSNTDWEVVTEADKVFSGSVTMASSEWTFITFDNPFIYDGFSNVVLVVDDNSGVYSSSPHMACRVFDAESQAIRVYCDYTNYNPMTPPTSYGSNENPALLSKKNQLLFTKEALSDCIRPTYLTATEVGPDFVTLEWTENGASVEWIIEISSQGNPREWNANSNPYTIDSLSPNTEYSVRVRSVCEDLSSWSNFITITTLESCPIPQHVEVSNITGNAATVTWNGYNDSYEVQLGIPSFMISTNFDDGIPSNWDNDSNYAWTLVDGHIQSSNYGVANTNSSISLTTTFPADGTIEFDAECMGEGSSTYWDHCDFSIDEEVVFTAGANLNSAGWLHYDFNVSEGEHTFTWSYTKDNSVNPNGDYFAIDNVILKTGETTWNEPIAVGTAEYIFRGLDPETTYCVKVQGICDNTETEWTEIILFTTTETTVITQTIVLEGGNNGAISINWCSFNVEITMEELRVALVAALPNTVIKIQSQSDNCQYNPSNHRWTGKLNQLDLSQMYKILVSETAEITLEGMPINPEEQSITIIKGSNWIAFPLSESMTLTDAFAGFAIQGDKVQSQGQNAVFNRGRWQGQLNTLEPGMGFIYESGQTENRTFNYPIPSKAPKK